jgi:pimeloyl-ACP methyl ester carboxylesterase
MQTLRTPEHRFADLRDFPFKPHYLSDLTGFEGVRIHYVDEGSNRSNNTVLCLHGNPTWSYLYRKMIPVFVQAGCRVVAPDLLGMGRSDKLVDQSDYTFELHRQLLIALIKKLDLRDMTLVCQDWGGLLGLTIPMEMPERFKNLLVMNTALATGGELSEGFVQWRQYSNAHPDMDVARLMQRAVAEIQDHEAAAYAAPFPDQSYKAALHAFPNLVPDRTDAPAALISRQAAKFWAQQWHGRSLMVIGMQDKVIPPPAMHHLRQIIKNCPEPIELADAGHFVQEHGKEVALAAVKAFGLASSGQQTGVNQQ